MCVSQLDLEHRWKSVGLADNPVFGVLWRDGECDLGRVGDAGGRAGNGDREGVGSGRGGRGSTVRELNGGASGESQGEWKDGECQGKKAEEMSGPWRAFWKDDEAS